MTQRTDPMRAALDQALVGITKLKERLALVEHASREPVAIIGIGCRYPGGVSRSGVVLAARGRGHRCGDAEVPPERWDIDALYDPDPDAPGKMTTRWGGFVSDIDQFDPAFFGISPREAAAWIRSSGCCWRRAGRRRSAPGSAPDRLMGSRHGVFVGLSVSRLRLAASAGARAARRLRRNGERVQRCVGPHQLRAGLQGPEPDGGHGVLVVTGDGAPGLPGAAPRRVLDWRSPAGRP